MLVATAFELLWRNWALVTIALTVVTLVIIPLLVIRKYVRISLNLMRSTTPPLTRNPLDYEPLVGEPVTFPAFDGLRLHGMLVRHRTGIPRRGLVVFAHEFCADMQSCARYCRPLQQVGYDILAFDFRGHGHTPCGPGYTPRQWVTNFDVDDMRGAIAFAQHWLEEQGLPREVGLFGISRGACAAILAARDVQEVRAIVSDGAYSTDTSIEYFMRRWAYIYAKVRVVYENHPPAFWRLLRWVMVLCASREQRCAFPSVRKAIARLRPVPMLFIHGERDSYLPVAQSRQLYALAPQPKFMWVAPGARHNQAVILHPERYAALTVAFLDQYLASRTADRPAPSPQPPRPAAGLPQAGETEPLSAGA